MTQLVELNNSGPIENMTPAQAFAALQGIALEYVDSYTLDLIKKVFPATTSGLEFTALLLQQAEPRQNLPAEIADLGEHIAVVRPRTIRTLAKKIGWGYDTTHKYVVVFKALALLDKRHYKGETYWLFPLTRYTPPPNLEALDQLILKSRPKVQQFARRVRERYLVYFDTALFPLTQTSAQSIPQKPSSAVDFSHDYMNYTFHQIKNLLQSEGVDSEKGSRIALRITSEVIAKIKRGTATMTCDTVWHKVSSKQTDLFGDTQSETFTCQVDSLSRERIQKKVSCSEVDFLLPENAQYEAYPSQGDFSPQENMQVKIEMSMEDSETHGEDRSQATESRQEDFFAVEVDFTGQSRNCKGDFFPAVENSQVDSPVLKVDFAYQTDREQEDFSPAEVDFLSTSASKQEDSNLTWEDFLPDDAAPQEDLSGPRIPEAVDMSHYSSEFARAYVTLNVKDFINKTYNDVTLRTELQKFLAQVFDRNTSKQRWYKRLLDECGIDALFTGFVYSLSLLHKYGNETIINPGAFFIQQTKKFRNSDAIEYSVTRLVEKHEHLTYEQLIAYFKTYTANQKSRKQAKKTSSIKNLQDVKMDCVEFCTQIGIKQGYSHALRKALRQKEEKLGQN